MTIGYCSQIFIGNNKIPVKINWNIDLMYTPMEEDELITKIDNEAMKTLQLNSSIHIELYDKDCVKNINWIKEGF